MRSPMGYSGCMKRLNPKTNQPFKSGDVREDGFIFRRYNLQRKRPNGEFLEQWYSPENYAKGRKRERVYMAERAAQMREVVRQYKLDKGCADCGYNAHSSALDFDHRPGVKKLFDVSGAVARDPVALQLEMQKCDVVCANCHRIRTFNRGTNFIGDGKPKPSFACV